MHYWTLRPPAPTPRAAEELHGQLSRVLLCFLSGKKDIDLSYITGKSTRNLQSIETVGNNTYP